MLRPKWETAASSDLETNSEYSGDAGEEEEEGQGHRMQGLGSCHLGVNGCVGVGVQRFVVSIAGNGCAKMNS